MPTKNAGKSGINHKGSMTKFGMALRKMVPDNYPHKISKSNVLKREEYDEVDRCQHYSFPPLKKCRKHFESIIGFPIEWDNKKDSFFDIV